MLNVGECIRLKDDFPLPVGDEHLRNMRGYVIKRIKGREQRITYFVQFDNGQGRRLGIDALRVISGKFKVGTKVRIKKSISDEMVQRYYLHHPHSGSNDLRGKTGTVSKFMEATPDSNNVNQYVIRLTVNRIMFRKICSEDWLESTMKNDVVIIEEE